LANLEHLGLNNNKLTGQDFFIFIQPHWTRQPPRLWRCYHLTFYRRNSFRNC
jgi:hypothetical protein